MQVADHATQVSLPQLMRVIKRFNLPGELPKMLKALHQEYGETLHIDVPPPFSWLVGTNRIIITGSSMLCNHILENDTDAAGGTHAFTKANMLFAALSEFIGHSLFVTTGDQYHSDKTVLAKAFTADSVARYTDIVGGSAVRIAIEAIGPRRKVDLVQAIDKISIKLLLELLFSKDTVGDDETERIIHLLNAGIAYVLKRAGTQRWLPQRFTPGYADFKAAQEAAIEDIEGIINRRIKSGETKHDLLQVMLNAVDSGEMTMENVVDQILGFIQGAYDAVSGLTSCFLAEILSSENSNSTLSALRGNDWNTSPKVEQILTIAARLWTPVHMSVRGAATSSVFNSGSSPIQFHEGDLVVLNLLQANLTSLDEAADLVFGAGVHACLGKHLGLLMVKAIAHAITSVYEISLEEAVSALYTATNRPKELICTLKRR